MEIAEYPVQSLTFTGLGAEGATPGAAAEALAAALNAWAASHSGRRLLHFSTVPAPAAAGVGLAAILIHIVGSQLPGELAEQVAAAVEDAIQETSVVELGEPLRRPRGLG
jgi:hypothetical protein